MVKQLKYKISKQIPIAPESVCLVCDTPNYEGKFDSYFHGDPRFIYRCKNCKLKWSVIASPNLNREGRIRKVSLN